jgi:hypothetical protein
MKPPRVRDYISTELRGPWRDDGKERPRNGHNGRSIEHQDECAVVVRVPATRGLHTRLGRPERPWSTTKVRSPVFVGDAPTFREHAALRASA